MDLTRAMDPPNIADLVNGIPALTRGELIERWCKCYGNPPHKAISTRLLVFAAAYAMQAERHGGLSRRAQKELMRLSGTAAAQHDFESFGVISPMARRNQPTHQSAAPRQGTRFVREWNGKSHVVEVVDKGFAWQGKTYRSLSAIATYITGARWSGPRFFGLVQ